MTIERLKALAEAYGADLRRWPASERPFAESLVATDPAARAALDEAAALDVLLDASPRPAPSAALTARILAAAPRGREARAHLGRIFWFLGAGWAAAACAGVVAGVGLTTHLTADEQADAVLYQATLSGVDDTEVLG
jgi:hypothetical protein